MQPLLERHARTAQGVDGAADRVAAVEHRRGAAVHLDAADGVGVDRRPVLVRALAEDGVVEAF